MNSGFAGGEDEIYNVYDQAWRGSKDLTKSIYRPSKNLNKNTYGDDIETRIKTNRIVPDKAFSGSDHRQSGRERPIQFEEDPFGLDEFLEEAKQHSVSKRPSDSSLFKEQKHEGKKWKRDYMGLLKLNLAYTAEDCLVWPLWEKMYLRLETPGSGDILWSKRRKNGMRNCFFGGWGQDLEGNKDCTVKNKIKD